METTLGKGLEHCNIRGRGDHVVQGPIYYRISDDNTGPELLLEVCMERGWRIWDHKDSTSSEESDNHQWHLWWRHGFPGLVYRRLKHNQVVNHIPRANGLCRKDTLARTLQKMKHAFPHAYDFSPPTFLLPGEYTKLVAEYTRILYHTKASKTNCPAGAEDQYLSTSPRSSEAGDPPALNIWICKPTGSSQGKGITVFQDLHDLSYGGSAVVQRYLEHPLLVGGYKCDIRLYVLVTCFIPLSVYIYSEGIVRFATEKYSLEALDNPYSHLTNTSINRVSPGYKLEKNRVGTGCKWTLGQLRRHLKSNGQRDWLLWQKVNVLVSLTLLSQVSRFVYNDHSSPFTSATDVPRHGTCFELYGFDILVDEGLTPWLLEVNRCPSLTYDCDVDRVVKKPLLHHLFDLVGPPKVSQPIERPFQGSHDLHYGSRGMENSSPAASDKNPIYRRRRSSLCEECDEATSRFSAEDSLPNHLSRRENSSSLFRWRSGLKTPRSVHTSPKVSQLLTALSRSEGNVSTKASSHPFSRSCRNRRRRSVTYLKADLSPSAVAEEINGDTYVPLNHNSAFYRLRNQFLSDSNRFYLQRTSWASQSSVEGSTKSFSVQQDCRPQHKQPSKCGDWIRTFPYNAATLHGSKNPMYLKNLVAELLKYRKTCEKVFKDNLTTEDEELNRHIRKLLWGGHILWSPKTS